MACGSSFGTCLCPPNAGVRPGQCRDGRGTAAASSRSTSAVRNLRLVQPVLDARVAELGDPVQRRDRRNTSADTATGERTTPGLRRRGDLTLWLDEAAMASSSAPTRTAQG